jgi:hypothetical protein
MSRRILILLPLLLAASSLHAATMTIADYTASLTRIRGFIAIGNIDAARAEGKALNDVDIDSPNGRFRTDSTLLAEIAVAKPRDLGVEARIDATLVALRSTSAAKTAPVDTQLLERLQRAQTAPELPRGGDIRGVRANGSLLERIAAAIQEAALWVVDKIEKFFDWLGRFWPDSSGKKTAPAAKNMRGMVSVLVGLILIVLGVLAFEVIRRSRKASASIVQESAPIESSHDDDPLSRGANEWERYAAQLAAAGRLREAIRAWYHAVLVTLYGANILHFRKGRTNWEYLAAIGPEISWRAELVGLTRRFEEEWYGSDSSSTDALDDCRAAAQRVIHAVRSVKREAA